MIVRLPSILNKCIYIPKNTDTYGPTEPDLCDTVRMPGLVEISNLATQHLASRKIFFSVSLGLSLVQKNQRAPIEKKNYNRNNSRRQLTPLSSRRHVVRHPCWIMIPRTDGSDAFDVMIHDIRGGVRGKM